MPLAAPRPVTAGTPRLDEAVALLRSLSGPEGIHASRTATTNYRAVFARDAVMAGIAGLVLGDDVVADGLVRTLERLRDLQGPEGQVASNFELRPESAPKVSFGSLAPRVDAVTWYLLGVSFAARAGRIALADHEVAVRAAVRLLDALEWNGWHLLYVPPGGNWADEYPYDGYVLYDQVLRGWALRRLGETLGKFGWREKASRIAHRIEATYWPGDIATRGYPLAAHSPTRQWEMFDLAACSLLALSHLVPARAGEALRHVDETWLARGALPPVFAPVMDESHPEWHALARYHLHGFRNRPHEYHNGGIWPVWLGWLALALAECGRHDALARLRATVRARLDALPDFAFEEFLHGETGQPGGTPGMAYTATGLVFLEHADAPGTLELLRP